MKVRAVGPSYSKIISSIQPLEIYATVMFDGDEIYHINFFNDVFHAVDHFNNSGGFNSYDSIYAITLNDPRTQWRKIVIHSSENKIFSFYDERLSKTPFLFNKTTNKWEVLANEQ